MAQSPTIKMPEPVRRGIIAVLYVIGSALAFYNLTAFKTDRFGVYFNDDNQLWLAVGVAMITAAWLTTNWKKL